MTYVSCRPQLTRTAKARSGRDGLAALGDRQDSPDCRPPIPRGIPRNQERQPAPPARGRLAEHQRAVVGEKRAALRFVRQARQARSAAPGPIRVDWVRSGETRGNPPAAWP